MQWHTLFCIGHKQVSSLLQLHCIGWEIMHEVKNWGLYGAVFKGIVPRYKGWLPTNEPGRAHAENKNWAWQMTNKFASHIQVCLLRLSLQCIQRLKHRMCSIALTYQYFYPLDAHSWRFWTFHSIMNKNLIFALYVFDLRILPCIIPRYLVCPYFLYPL